MKYTGSALSGVKRSSLLSWTLMVWVYNKYEGRRRLTGVELISHSCTRYRKIVLRLRVKSLSKDHHPGMVSTVTITVDTHRESWERSLKITRV